jgi:2-hydroxy-3-oxopropionate reductase
MLPNSPDVRQVVLGERGVLDGARPGLLLIDTSSIAPGVARELSQAAAERGVRMLDAPVSGGEPKAKDGTLSFMVGGACADFEEVRELLAAMGKNIAWIGEAGSGQVAKLANQIIVGLNIIGAAEAMVLAAKAGVSPRSVYQAIRGGLAGSTVLDAKAPMMFDRNFAPGFRIELHLKDLLNALDTAHQCGAPAPFTSLAAETMNAVKAAGKGKLDHAALVHFFELLAGVEVG